MAISKSVKQMLAAATERARACDEDWSKNPGGIDLTPRSMGGSSISKSMGGRYGRVTVPYTMPYKLGDTGTSHAERDEPVFAPSEELEMMELADWGTW